MCATISTKDASLSTQNLISNPKKNKPSHKGKNTYMNGQHGNSALPKKPRVETREAKRKRWAKKAKPVTRPVVKKGPVHEYISKCCGLPANKPRCGERFSAQDPDSGKMKDQTKGLGHWRCSGCKKVCKVTPRKPAPTGAEVISPASPVGVKVIVADLGAIEQRVIEETNETHTAG
jgi:hypothetical protein